MGLDNDHQDKVDLFRLILVVGVEIAAVVVVVCDDSDSSTLTPITPVDAF